LLGFTAVFERALHEIFLRIVRFVSEIVPASFARRFVRLERVADSASQIVNSVFIEILLGFLLLFQAW